MVLKMFKSENPPPPLSGVKNVLAIAAGKGGVGKSTVTVNLAYALYKLGYQVGILDSDIYGPSIRKMLPEDRLPIQKGSTLFPALCRGIRVISMAYFRKESEASVVRAPIANGIIAQFIRNVDWGLLDYLLIDFPPGTGDVQLTLGQQANLTGAIMVTTPQEVALIDVRKAMRMFDQIQIPIVGIVENMSYYSHPDTKEPIYLFGRGGGERLAREEGAPYLCGIPISASLCQSGDKGESIFDSTFPEKCIGDVFLSLGKQVKEHVEALKTQSEGCLSHFELTWREMV